MKFKTTMVALGIATAISGSAQAGSIYLTGHDVLFHGGQNNYDGKILNYLRGAGTTSEIAAGSYNIGLVRGFSGGVSTGDFSAFGTTTTRDLTSFTSAADFSSFLSGVDVLVIPSHTSCGGCDLSTADANILEGFSSQITSFFNAGGDIYANSGARDTTFYNFLPPSAVASGTSIGGSTGFTATAAGLGIGIANNNINGFPTHNKFSSFDPAFTVFETRGTETISIGIRDASIGGGGIITGGGSTVPEPGTIALLGLGALGLARSRKKA